MCVVHHVNPFCFRFYRSRRLTALRRNGEGVNGAAGGGGGAEANNNHVISLDCRSKKCSNSVVVEKHEYLPSKGESSLILLKYGFPQYGTGICHFSDFFGGEGMQQPNKQKENTLTSYLTFALLFGESLYRKQTVKSYLPSISSTVQTVQIQYDLLLYRTSAAAARTSFADERPGSPEPPSPSRSCSSSAICPGTFKTPS